ncbi:MAG TPA: retropepsin-like aspartic protease [Coleofasciculaceae cyanobacterium]
MQLTKRLRAGAGIGCVVAMLFAGSGFAEETLQADEQTAAVLFFNRIAQESNNPYVTAIARESAARLAAKPMATRSSRQEIPVISQPDSSIAVPALVNNKTMGTFIIDTGSSYTVITPRMANKLGVVVTADTPTVSIITANGVIQAPMVTLKNVMIGQVRVDEVQAVIQDLGKDLMLSGLLGMNFFKGKSLTIRQDRLILEENMGNGQLSSL